MVACTHTHLSAARRTSLQDPSLPCLAGSSPTPLRVPLSVSHTFTRKSKELTQIKPWPNSISTHMVDKSPQTPSVFQSHMSHDVKFHDCCENNKMNECRRVVKCQQVQLVKRLRKINLPQIWASCVCHHWSVHFSWRRQFRPLMLYECRWYVVHCCHSSQQTCSW